MTRFALTLMAVLLLTLTGCARLLVETDYDHDRDFSGYASWSWAEGAGSPDFAIDPMCRAALQREMNARGLEMKESGGDLTVDYTLSKVEHVSTASSEVREQGGTRVGRRHRPTSGRPHKWSYEEGSLSLFISDAASGDVVWSGVAKEVVDARRTDEQRQGLANDAAKALLDGFPPGR